MSEALLDRRRFLATSLAALAGGCAAPASSRIDLTPAFATRVTGRGFPPYLDARNSSFPDHIRRQEYSLGGVEYGPMARNEDTLVCPTAAGVVIGAQDNTQSGGMMLTVGHGLGWKTAYAHLQARFVGYRELVERRDVMAVMGASGAGAARGGLGVQRHLHLTLWGPAWSPMLGGVNLQARQGPNPAYRYALDPEEFSLAGRNQYLPHQRVEDGDAHDRAFEALHAEAVQVCDDLLDRLADRDAAKIRERGQFERETRLDDRVDLRLGFLWERLERGAHPFAPETARGHRATLLRFMSTPPRFTAPIVELERRGDYHMGRDRPMKVYAGRSL